MKRCLILVFVFGLAGLFIAGCGPSAEEIATLTAAAWTINHPIADPDAHSHANAYTYSLRGNPLDFG